MKLLTLTALLAVATPGFAQHGRESTLLEDAWFKLVILVQDEEALTERLRQHGFSEQAVQPLRNYVTRARSSLDELARKHARELCERGDGFRNDPERLAQEFERQDARYDAIKKGAVDNLSSVLGEADLLAFNTLIAHGPRSRSIDTDIPTAVRTGTLKADDAIDRACARAAQ